MTPIELPWPPSVNRYWRSWKGRVLISKEGRRYRQMVVRLALLQKFPRFGSARVKVVIEACAPDRRRRDLDNLNKAVLDALQAAGVYDDDCQVDELTITRGPIAQEGHLKITIEELKREST